MLACTTASAPHLVNPSTGQHRNHHPHQSVQLVSDYSALCKSQAHDPLPPEELHCDSSPYYLRSLPSRVLVGALRCAASRFAVYSGRRPLSSDHLFPPYFGAREGCLSCLSALHKQARQKRGSGLFTTHHPPCLPHNFPNRVIHCECVDLVRACRHKMLICAG